MVRIFPLIIAVVALLTGCDTVNIVQFGRASEVKVDDTKWHVPAHPPHQSAFLAKSPSQSGYFSLSVQYIPPNNPETPVDFINNADGVVSLGDICGNPKRFTLKKNTTKGFVSATLGEPPRISKNKAKTAEELKNTIPVFEYQFFDTNQKDDFRCFFYQVEQNMVTSNIWKKRNVPIQYVALSEVEADTKLDEVAQLTVGAINTVKDVALPGSGVALNAAAVQKVRNWSTNFDKVMDVMLSETKLPVEGRININVTNDDGGKHTRAYLPIYIEEKKNNKIISKKYSGSLRFWFKPYSTIFDVKPEDYKQTNGAPNFVNYDESLITFSSQNNVSKNHEIREMANHVYTDAKENLISRVNDATNIENREITDTFDILSDECRKIISNSELAARLGDYDKAFLIHTLATNHPIYRRLLPTDGEVVPSENTIQEASGRPTAQRVAYDTGLSKIDSTLLKLTKLDRFFGNHTCDTMMGDAFEATGLSDYWNDRKNRYTSELEKWRMAREKWVVIEFPGKSEFTTQYATRMFDRFTNWMKAPPERRNSTLNSTYFRGLFDFSSSGSTVTFDAVDVKISEQLSPKVFNKDDLIIALSNFEAKRIGCFFPLHERSNIDKFQTRAQVLFLNTFHFVALMEVESPQPGEPRFLKIGIQTAQRPDRNYDRYITQLRFTILENGDFHEINKWDVDATSSCKQLREDAGVSVVSSN
tara:strand:+ start:432 stop:2540 length:2109 start_codon:yes stop_codon:yes gene_type:complete